MPDKNSRKKPSYHKTQIAALTSRYVTGSKFTKGAERSASELLSLEDGTAFVLPHQMRKPKENN